MSIVSVNEVAQERSGQETISGVEYIRVFDVTTDSVNDSPYTVKEATDLPSIGDEYPDDSAATLRSKIVSAFDEGRIHWRVQCVYSSPSAGAGGGQITTSADPLDEPPQIRFGFTQYNRALDKAYQSGDTRYIDVFGVGGPTKKVVNSAKIVFNPPLEQEESNQLIIITRNEAFFRPDTAATYKNTCNKDAITIAGVRLRAYQGRMLDFAGTKMWDQRGREYWQVHYEIEVDIRTHTRQILDKGMYKDDPDTHEKDKNEDSDGDQMIEPFLMDGAGQKLAWDDDPVYLPYYTYWKIEWLSLNLPMGY